MKPISLGQRCARERVPLLGTTFPLGKSTPRNTKLIATLSVALHTDAVTKVIVGGRGEGWRKIRQPPSIAIVTPNYSRNLKHEYHPEDRGAK